MPYERSPTATLPLGKLALEALITWRTCSRLTPYWLSRSGFSSTRTAGNAPPPTVTSPTPVVCNSRCSSSVEATSYICPGVALSEVRLMIKIGESAGLTLRYVGLPDRSLGRLLRAALIAACTSRAAPSMSRSRSNCKIIRAEPRLLDEVICVTPAICPNWRSRGVATELATVVGSAPGNEALTLMVGKSTSGSGATGNRLKANTPNNASPAASNVVAIGRWINGALRFIASFQRHRAAAETLPQAVHGEEDHRRGKQREQLAEQQPADNRDAQRVAQLRADAGAQRQRHRAEQRGHAGHQDRPKAQLRRLANRFHRAQAALAQKLQREVDHHDAVFHDDADQQHNANQADDVELRARHQQRQQRAEGRRQQGRQDGHRVHEALVQNAQHQVHHHNRRQHQKHLV